MRRVVFRADGDEKTGLGHLMRCLSLASMLRNDFRIIFISRNSGEYLKSLLAAYTHEYFLFEHDDRVIMEKVLQKEDLLVADGYSFSEEWRKYFQAKVAALIMIDDLIYKEPSYIDVIVNHAYSVKAEDYKNGSNTRFLLGPQYAMIRPAFLEHAKSSSEPRSRKGITIIMGGADPENLSSGITEMLLEISKEEITVVTGAAYVHEKSQALQNKRVSVLKNLNEENLCSLLSESNVVICTASTVSMEVCAVRTPMIAGLIANNQEQLYKGLCENNCAAGIGWYKDLSKEKFKNVLSVLLYDVEKYSAQIKAQEKFIDGKSPERFVKIFQEL